MIVYKKSGRGLINKAINKLPIELHIPGYKFCGPGTKLAKRLARGDVPINPLDSACKEHDIAYSKNPDNIEARNAADRDLANRAWQRVKSKDASFGERASAYLVTNTMKLKNKLGMGIKTKRQIKKKKKTSFNKVRKAASIKGFTSKNAKDVIRLALQKAKAAVKAIGGKSGVQIPRILPMSSKTGGYLPFLIPLFAGLSATGALAGGAAGIAKAVNSAKAAQKQLAESERHNKTMEAIALGRGLYLKPYKSGYGLFLKPGKGLKKKRSTKRLKKKSSMKRSCPKGH